MKIALIGYGKMGHIIEEMLRARGHELACAIDVNNLEDFDSDAFKSADVAIEFTTPKTALGNVAKCLDKKVPVVVGSTGWYDQLPQVKADVEKADGSLFWASNFSIGVNVFTAAQAYVAKIMNNYPQYDVAMEEVHHVHKLDAPSGTAITIAKAITDQLDRKEELNIASMRVGEVPGIHTVVYDSEVDTITMTHSAKSRKGFALGAVIAAEWLVGQGVKKGVYTMSDMMPFLNA